MFPVRILSNASRTAGDLAVVASFLRLLSVRSLCLYNLSFYTPVLVQIEQRIVQANTKVEEQDEEHPVSKTLVHVIPCIRVVQPDLLASAQSNRLGPGLSPIVPIQLLRNREQTERRIHPVDNRAVHELQTVPLKIVYTRLVSAALEPDDIQVFHGFAEHQVLVDDESFVHVLFLGVVLHKAPSSRSRRQSRPGLTKSSYGCFSVAHSSDDTQQV